MTSALLIGRNRESATMTSACLLEKVIISNYDVSNQQSIRSARAGSAMMTSAVTSSQSAVRYSTTSRWYLKLAIAKRCRLDKWIRQRFAFALRFSRCSLRCRKMMYQSQATSVSSRELQCFTYPVDRKSRRKETEEIFSRKEVEDTTSSEAVDEFYYEDSLKFRGLVESRSSRSCWLRDRSTFSKGKCSNICSDELTQIARDLCGRQDL
ncbi:hypothetical protein F511_33753 [Dorcoceras hygrometricum]|uniref:Uncharacterized protein n=1 Tax=Dorcoceras hygrometricum TaxID=472368 RepID=A0A2Z7API5_9LAMI|nr:hypothetical protein F511_33753 [Dorcoceras hygrometricum]